MFDTTDFNLETTTPSVAARRHASALPADAVAVIRPSERSAMSSGRATARGWTLTFKPRSAPRIEPLMGWTDNGIISICYDVKSAEFAHFRSRKFA